MFNVYEKLKMLCKSIGILEVLGNLESTGMVPRERKERPRPGSVRNFLEPQDFSAIELRASPVDSDETI